jgi:hypothetical protein
VPASLCGQSGRACYSPWCSIPNWESSPGAAAALHAIARDTTGDLLAVGSSGSVVRTDSTGALMWSHPLSGVQLSSVSLDAAGYVYAVGNTVSSTGTVLDAFVAKLTP